MAQWTGQAAIKGSSEEMRLAALTFCSLGISFTWGIEMTYCTPYLLALGLTKSKTSLVWIAGPLSGMLVAPVVGVLADRSTSPYGRRRPFIVLGSLVVAVCLLMLGWAKEIVGYFFDSKTQPGRSYAIIVAVLAIYGIDFSINAVMWSCRSLIVDTLPASKQQAGAAWSSRMGGIGHLLAYFIGTLDLVAILGPSYGDTQFKQLIFIAVGSLLLCVGVTTYAVSERVLVSRAGNKDESNEKLVEPQDSSLGLGKIFGQILSTMRNLPPAIQGLCWAQFWSWIGWFPFLFYSSTWVGETYFRYDAPKEVKGSKDALGDIGRIGSMSLVICSTVSLLGAIAIPLLVRPSEHEKFTRRPPASIAGFVSALEKYRPDLLEAWTIGHAIFACAMLMAPFAHSFRVASLLVGLCGLSWTVAMWAPYAYLGQVIAKLNTSPAPPRPRRSSPHGDLELAANGASSSKRAPSPAYTPEPNSSELSGIYFGILNIYTTIPQFIASFLGMVVFAIMEPGKSPELAQDAHPSEHHDTDGTNAISICLFLGAVSTLGSVYATRRLSRLDRGEDV